MREASDRSPAAQTPWTDTVNIRIHLPRSREIDGSVPDNVNLHSFLGCIGIDERYRELESKTHENDEQEEEEPPGEDRFTRIGPYALMTLRRLPPHVPLVLFTPFLTPAGTDSPASNTSDPFEAFGRQLAAWHPNIRHVPYVATVGFTPTHRAFVNDCEAVITVICEPAGATAAASKASMSEQHDFAEAAAKAFGDPGDVRHRDCRFVLVQFARPEVRWPAQHAVFENVIEVENYDEGQAEQLAEAILGRADEQTGLISFR